MKYFEALRVRRKYKYILFKDPKENKIYTLFSKNYTTDFISLEGLQQEKI